MDAKCDLDGSKWNTSLRTLLKKGILLCDRSNSRLKLTSLGMEIAHSLNSYSQPQSLIITTNPFELPSFTFDLTQDSGSDEVRSSPLQQPQNLQCFDLSQLSEETFDVSEIEVTHNDQLSRVRKVVSPVEADQVDPEFLRKARANSVIDENEPVCFSQPTTAQEKRQCKIRRIAPRVVSYTQTFTSTLTSNSHPSGEGRVDLSEWEVVILIDKREKDYSFFEAYFNEKGVRSEVGLHTLSELTPVRYAS
jgi:hypothetical protein